MCTIKVGRRVPWAKGEKSRREVTEIPFNMCAHCLGTNRASSTLVNTHSPLLNRILVTWGQLQLPHAGVLASALGRHWVSRRTSWASCSAPFFFCKRQMKPYRWPTPLTIPGKVRVPGRQGTNNVYSRFLSGKIYS